MKKIILLLLTLAVGSVSFVPRALGKSKIPQQGQVLPQFILPAPDELHHRNYLGIREEETFKVSQIKAPIIIIEIFSMYCPYCQREAPNINALYERIMNSNKLKTMIKIIGIGAGNSPFEVDFFRKKFSIPFPLFPDPDFKIHKILGETRTPYFFVVKNSESGLPLIIYSKLGSIGDLGQFLTLLMDRFNKTQE